MLHHMSSKSCSKCKLDQPLAAYSNCKARRDGKCPVCKVCKKEDDRRYRSLNLEKKRAKDREYARTHAESIRAKAAAWYKANPQQARASRKKWFENNRDKHYVSARLWRSKNVEVVRAYMRNWCKQKYDSDEAFRTRAILSSRLRGCVKKKTEQTMDVLGCDISAFLDWIEYQFEEDMSWDNMGTYWVIDHVVPCASFDLSNKAAVAECFHWSNMRPLEAKENMSKGSKVLLDVIAAHRKVVASFSM